MARYDNGGGVPATSIADSAGDGPPAYAVPDRLIGHGPAKRDGVDHLQDKFLEPGTEALDRKVEGPPFTGEVGVKLELGIGEQPWRFRMAAVKRIEGDAGDHKPVAFDPDLPDGTFEHSDELWCE